VIVFFVVVVLLLSLFPRFYFAVGLQILDSASWEHGVCVFFFAACGVCSAGGFSPCNLQGKLSGEEREQFHAYYMSYHYKLSGIRWQQEQQDQD
jgi:hypothetical protein